MLIPRMVHVKQTKPLDGHEHEINQNVGQVKNNKIWFIFPTIGLIRQWRSKEEGNQREKFYCWYFCYKLTCILSHIYFVCSTGDWIQDCRAISPSFLIVRQSLTKLPRLDSNLPLSCFIFLSSWDNRHAPPYSALLITFLIIIINCFIIDYRIQFKILCMTFRALSNLDPIYLDGFIYCHKFVISTETM